MHVWGRVVEAADVITANLTGALLCRAAPTLVSALAPGGSLIVSGLLARERGDVIAAFCGKPRPGVYARGRGPAKPQPRVGVEPHANLKLVREQEEDGWLGLVFEKRLPCPEVHVAGYEKTVTVNRTPRTTV